MHHDDETHKVARAKIAKDKARAMRSQAGSALVPLRAALLRRAGELELAADALLARETADVVLVEAPASTRSLINA